MNLNFSSLWLAATILASAGRDTQKEQNQLWKSVSAVLIVLSSYYSGSIKL